MLDPNRHRAIYNEDCIGYLHRHIIECHIPVKIYVYCLEGRIRG